MNNNDDIELLTMDEKIEKQEVEVAIEKKDDSVSKEYYAIVVYCAIAIGILVLMILKMK